MDPEIMKAKIDYANKVIEEYLKSDDFKEFNMMEIMEKRSYKLFTASIEFLASVERAVDQYEIDKKKCL